MPKLVIPARYQQGLGKIRKLDETSIRTIKNALDKAPATTKPSDVGAVLASVASDTNVQDFREIGEALASLYIVKSANEVSVEQFTEDISEALSADPQKLPTGERLEFKKKLAELLSAESFTVVSKAFDLATEDERIFHGARILTDLRAVFGSNIEDGIKGAVIVHLLKIGYHTTDERHQEFNISLDSEDLKTLKKVIERAEAKAQSIRSKFKEVPFLGIS